MFMGPLEAVKPWQASQLMGVVRFREKIYNLARTHRDSLSAAAPQGAQLKEMHRVVKKVTADIENMAFNTAISNLMIYTNFLVGAAKEGPGVLSKQALETLVLLVSPFAPHVAEECWALLGHKQSLAYAPWPTHQEEFCVEEKCTLPVSVNGKPRGALEVPAPAVAGAQASTAPSGADAKTAGKEHASPEQDALVAQALEQERVRLAVGGKPIKKVIYVPGKILNIIV